MHPRPLAFLAALALVSTAASARAGTWAPEPAGLPGWPPTGGSLARRPVDPWIGAWSPFAPVEAPARSAFGIPLSNDDGPTALSTLAEDLPELQLIELSLFSTPSADAQGIDGCELVMDGGSGAGVQAWEQNLWLGAPWPTIKANGHTDKDGRWVDYDQIGRRWDRPEAYAAYRYPIANAMVVSGYDLDKPDDRQRRGKMSAVGHGGVDIPEKKGTPITMIALDHQMGDAEVLYVGHLFGETVVTRHTLREGGRKREYVLLFGHLEEAAEGVRRGRRLRPGQLVGYVGNTDSPEFVHLHLEARRLREGVDPWKLAAWNINAREISVVTDPRNVLPLMVPRRAKPKCAPKLFAPRPSGWTFPTMKLMLGGDAKLERAE